MAKKSINTRMDIDPGDSPR